MRVLNNLKYILILKSNQNVVCQFYCTTIAFLFTKRQQDGCLHYIMKKKLVVYLYIANVRTYR